MGYEHPTDGGLYLKKIPLLKTLTPGNPMIEFDPKIAPQPTDKIIDKQFQSAFFGTTLCGNLHALVWTLASSWESPPAVVSVQRASMVYNTGFDASYHVNVLVT